jgi:hypothetical protein
MQPAYASPLSGQPQAGIFWLSLRGLELADAAGFHLRGGAVLGGVGAFGGGYGLARISALTYRRAPERNYGPIVGAPVRSPRRGE